MKVKKDNLGDRMKGYESASRHFLLRRTPVIIRVDGKAFHTFTKRLTPEIDPSEAYGPGQIMHNIMVQTMDTLLNKVQNAVFAYQQSDEISILLRDWDKHETEQWFDGNLQKLASVSASIATEAFTYSWMAKFGVLPRALFDSRAFNVPAEEVVNYFIWRQQDATRNSIQYIARKYFSHKELHGKSNDEIQEMLWREQDCNWNDYLTWKKRGTCAYRDPDGYIIDEEIPIFTQDRDYIGRHLEPKDDS